MAKIKINDIKPDQLIEHHQVGEDEFDVGYLVDHDADSALMRLIDTNGSVDSYYFFDYQMEKGYFKTDTKYLNDFKQVMKLANENGLKDTPTLTGVEHMEAKHMFDKMIKYLTKTKTYFEVQYLSKKKNLKFYEGYITEDRDKSIDVMWPDEVHRNAKGKTKTVNVDQIYSFSFNSWDFRFKTDIFNGTN